MHLCCSKSSVDFQPSRYTAVESELYLIINLLFKVQHFCGVSSQLSEMSALTMHSILDPFISDINTGIDYSSKYILVVIILLQMAEVGLVVNVSRASNCERERRTKARRERLIFWDALAYTRFVAQEEWRN